MQIPRIPRINLFNLCWRTIFLIYFSIILIYFYSDEYMASYCIATISLSSSLMVFNSLLPKFIEDKFHIATIMIWLERFFESICLSGLVIFSAAAKHHLFYPMIFIFSIYGWLSTLLMFAVYLMNLFDMTNAMELFSFASFVDLFNVWFCQ